VNEKTEESWNRDTFGRWGILVVFGFVRYARHLGVYRCVSSPVSRQQVQLNG